MKQVRDHIKARQARFAQSRFFARIEIDEASPEALSFMSGLTFFVMVFQDILRLNEARVKDPALRMIARHHRAEDSGHQEWFLHDLAAVEGRLPDVREVFSPGFATTRDAAYALAAEAIHAHDDRVSIALLLVLESTGHVFFNRVVEFLERIGCADGLLYFARSHLDVELGHELFEAKMNRVIDAIVLDEVDRARVIAAVDRCFDPITDMIEALQECSRSAPPGRSEAPPSRSDPPVSGVITRLRPFALPKTG